MPKRCETKPYKRFQIDFSPKIALWLQRLLFCLLATLSGLASSNASAPAFLDEMDGAEPVLQLAKESSFQMVAQYIERDKHLSGTGAEVVQLRGPAGESAQLSFELPSAPVISELSLTATISSNRPGIQIAARVVLPRSRDPLTGRSLELLLRGSNLSRGMPGEQLQLSELPQLLAEQTRIARIRAEGRIDQREAFVTQLVFMVPGGSGVTKLVVDRIELDGIVLERNRDPEVVTASSESLVVKPASKPSASESDSARGESLTPRKPQRVSAPIQRIIRWQGEPFEKLKELGFNTIWLSRVATSAELQEAQRLGIALVCPPPIENLASLQDEKWDHVLTWDLGSLVAIDDLEQVIRMKELIRRHDPLISRTTVMTCEQLSRDVSRTTDALLLGRELLGSDLTLRDFVTWLGQRQRLARPGTPLWTTIPTQVCPQRAYQIAALQGSSAESSPAGGSYEQLVAITSAAMSIRCRDFFFESYTSLASTDPPTLQRARNLELLNLRLRLLTPWLAAGKVAGVARSTVPGLSAIVMRAESSHLLLPITWSRDFRSQEEIHQSGPVSFVMSGVAETADAYLLSLVGAERVRHERTTGGIRISVDSLPADGMIMLTSDPQAFTQVSQFLRSIAGRASRLRRDLVARRLQQLVDVSNAASSEEATGVKNILDRSERELVACDLDLQRGFVEQAYRRILVIERSLSQAEYLMRNAGRSDQPQVVTPLLFGVDTINSERRLLETLSRATTKASLLAGGEFEDLQSLLAQGWRHKQLPVAGITSAVRLSPDAPHSGSYCLELEARGIGPSHPVSVVSTAPVWITSAPMPVKAGEFVEIMGMVRVPELLIGTVDGLEIIDSLGGAGMATRIKYAPSWQAFRVLRRATADTNLTVSLALTGLGRAQVDNLMVRSLQMPEEVAREQDSLFENRGLLSDTTFQ